MIKKIIISVKRAFKRLIFRFYHREGWAGKFAEEFLSDLNGATPVRLTRAYETFVENIAKIERSRISTGKKIRWIKDEKRILQLYGFAYRYPDRETRIRHEEMKKDYIASQGCLPSPSIFATS